MKRTKAEMLASAVSASERRRIEAQVPDDGSSKTESIFHIHEIFGGTPVNTVKKDPPSFLNVRTGNVCHIEPNTGFGDAGDEKVTDTVTKYDQDTGKPYKVICFGNWKFDARDGCPMTPPYAYHISHIVKE